MLSALFPGRKKALERALRSAEQAEDLTAVVAARRELADLEPRSANAWLGLARSLHKAGEPREALAAYRAAIERGASERDVQLQIGALHASLGEHDQAVGHLEKAVALAPDDADALCMLGTVMNDLLRFDEAGKVLERALVLRPDFSEAHFNLGLARFERVDFAAAARSFSRCVALNRGEPWSAARRAALDRDPEPRFAPKDMGVNPVKLGHDCEQLDYLLALGRLSPGYRDVLADYRALLAELAGVDIGSLVPFDETRHRLVARTYKRPVHIAEVPPPAGPLINPALDVRAVEDRYVGAKPGIVAVDSLLAPDALQALRRFCLESTIWNNVKPGYLGAYFYDGFCPELLLKLAWDLRERFPRIFKGLPLQMMWGYKCQSSLPGLGLHADAAAVNVNFWITEDEANLDPASGGLLVYPQAAPADWGFSKFNTDSETIQAFLRSTGGEPVRVPYRANRAVIFDSDLFHATDTPCFRDGYANRRINITLLYGLRST
jgi:tetratricopeptide (TPR) repeat protein